MSQTPMGPGWWQAPDGRWYPTHPAHLPAPRAGQAPGHAPPGPGGPGQVSPGQVPIPPKRGKVPVALIVVVALVAVVGGGLFLAGNLLFDRATDRVFGQSGCDFVGDDTASAILGGEFEFVQLSGITEMARVAADTRPLPDGTVCLGNGTDANGDRVVTVTRLETPDAATRFEQARTAAQGTEENRGDGLTVESPGFLGKDVQFGDQAFCTTADLTSSSGLFVRRGNVLLYVAMTASGIAQGDVPSIVPGEQVEFESDDANCELAQKLAAEIE